MEHSTPLKLDAVGQIIKFTDELEYRRQHNVDVYDRTVKSDRRRGVAVLTTHRLVWIDTERDRTVQWHLSQVPANGITTEEGTIFVGSAKIVLFLYAPSDAKKAVDPIKAGTYIKLSFKEGGRNEFLEAFQTVLRKKSWIKEEPAILKPLTPTVIGIDGVVQAQAARLSESKALASKAFSDLSALEKHAHQIVSMAKTYSAELQKKKEVGQDSEEKKLGSLYVDLGIIDPVTRESAGDLYITEVARQLAAFLRPHLERAGGVLTLTDVYCLYNRARATDLISPEDLLSSAQHMQPMRLGCHLRTFPSGLRVVESDLFSESEVVSRIKALLEARNKDITSLQFSAFLTATTLAEEWHIPAQIAKQHLLAAEAQGVLCRDDSVNGLRFYFNVI